MLINPYTHRPFTTLELSQVAVDYYDNFRSRRIQNGFTMFIATDGLHSMVVSKDYQPESEDIAMFVCEVRRSVKSTDDMMYGTAVYLYKTYTHDYSVNSVLPNPMAPVWMEKEACIIYNGKWYLPETEEQKMHRKGMKRSQSHTDNNDDND